MISLSRTFAGLALTAGAAWAAKTVLIAANGGTNTDEGVVAVCWAVGMVAFVLAAATGAALLLARQARWVRLAAALTAAPIAFVALDLLDSLLKSVYSQEGWMRDELGLLVGGALMAAAGARVLAGRPSRAGGDRVPA